MNASLSWLGIWALVAGWLVLVDFFLPSDPRGWGFAGLGLLLLVLASRRVRWRRIDPWAFLLVAPLLAAAFIWPYPHKAGPLLLLGALLLALPLRRASWLAPLTLGLGLAGMIWTAQSGAHVAYWWLGARYHEAPLLTPVLYTLSRLLGWSSGSSGGSLFLPHIGGTLRATTTWERLGAFPFMLFAAGGAVLLPLIRRRSLGEPVKRALVAGLIAIAYMLLRYLALVSIALIAGSSDVFWLPLPVALSFLPLAIALSRVLPLRDAVPEPAQLGGPQNIGPYAAFSATILLAALAASWILTLQDPGRAKAGRVLLDEYNSNWEWTTQVLDTEWYGQKSGYNYYSLGQWLTYYYRLDTNFEPRTPELLADYDVLIIKTPTAPFSSEEIDAIDEWVRAGGGLFLIGDHTNVFGTSSYLNPLARRFGLRFRYDSTYNLATLRVTLFQPPHLLAHPTVLEMPPFLFATSCTLEAPLLAGNVMTGYGLRALSVDYANRVFFPDKDKEQDYPFGLFLQSASVRQGRGRVVAFTDSTVFSNFTMFMPGKPEYFLGVINWLNHSQRWPQSTLVLGIVAGCAAGAAAYLARSLDRRRARLLGVGALLLAASVGPWGTRELAKASYRPPPPHTEYPRITFENEHSRIGLPTGPVAPPPDASIQTFYVWTQRLGYVPALAPTLEQALTQNQVVTIINPVRPFDPAEVSAVERFVAQGGRLLVLADAEGSNTVATQILAPFGLGLESRRNTTGTVVNAGGEPQIELQISGIVTGSDALLTLEGQSPVVSLARHGDGLVVATSFARPFYDRQMGTTSVLPTTAQRGLYEIEFWLFRSLMTGDFPLLQVPREGD